MKNMINSALALATIAALTACGGGGGGNYATNGTTYFSHEQLAQEFVRRLNIDVPGYNVVLTKTNTLQYDYIVVYDKSYKTYDAYYLGMYNPGENMAKYLNAYEYKFYYDLIAMNDGTYKDYVTGKLFEIASENSLDVEKTAAIIELAGISRAANTLREEYGMSEEASQDIARVATYEAKIIAAGGSVDTKAMDRVAAKYGNGVSYSKFLKGDASTQAKFLSGLADNTSKPEAAMQKLFTPAKK